MGVGNEFIFAYSSKRLESIMIEKAWRQKSETILAI